MTYQDPITRPVVRRLPDDPNVRRADQAETSYMSSILAVLPLWP